MDFHNAPVGATSVDFIACWAQLPAWLPKRKERARRLRANRPVALAVRAQAI